MLTSILTALLPGIGKSLVDAYKAKLDASNNSEKIASDLAARELAVQQAERIAEIGHWYEPAHLFGYIMVAYFGKVVLWDKVFAVWTHGSTDPIGGDVGAWAGWVMAFYFGASGLENVARILKR